MGRIPRFNSIDWTVLFQGLQKGNVPDCMCRVTVGWIVTQLICHCVLSSYGMYHISIQSSETTEPVASEGGESYNKRKLDNHLSDLLWFGSLHWARGWIQWLSRLLPVPLLYEMGSCLPSLVLQWLKRWTMILLFPTWSTQQPSQVDQAGPGGRNRENEKMIDWSKVTQGIPSWITGSWTLSSRYKSLVVISLIYGFTQVISRQWEYIYSAWSSGSIVVFLDS